MVVMQTTKTVMLKKYWLDSFQCSLTANYNDNYGKTIQPDDN